MGSETSRYVLKRIQEIHKEEKLQVQVWENGIYGRNKGKKINGSWCQVALELGKSQQ